ncbi:MAG: hypothetical protein Q7T00_04355 [Rugosibacter sp.]|jgi:hypothetical protein|nr:hypothetical protein [Rugosibacter sp.]MDO9273379.1 hypothetical protein [Rugosibacter sp.]
MTTSFKRFIRTSILSVAMVWASSTLAEAPVAIALTDVEQSAVFKAAGFTLKGKEWRACDTGDSGAPYDPGTIQEVRDLNGDGRPEAIVIEGGTYCYGHTGVGFALVSKQADGHWRLMNQQTGVPEILKARGASGWPDISVGGPGFCFPVERWNGKKYALHRFEYQGKRCKPSR